MAQWIKCLCEHEDLQIGALEATSKPGRYSSCSGGRDRIPRASSIARLGRSVSSRFSSERPCLNR